MASEKEHQGPTDTQKSLRPPPPLPARLLALPPLVYVGTAIWFAAAGVFAVLHYAFELVPAGWLWTALAGVFLGFIGMPIMWWQTSASRRGTRTAQRNL
ncbi:MAG TPA: DUF2530 domain-containing protein [Actinophytocola sp.]|uniref:DUF2530 domain-containing protein n=1 Tax=Actinophytocola sp. TaxID=1872138 RepID=UPI002DBF6A54|nr:DUF2530 domain-containing protein [Actinophytocola sp.]HEU5475464.1 DUF2530 domain-containing protein [Actinophytocola sp.]